MRFRIEYFFLLGITLISCYASAQTSTPQTSTATNTSQLLPLTYIFGAALASCSCVHHAEGGAGECICAVGCPQDPHLNMNDSANTPRPFPFALASMPVARGFGARSNNDGRGDHRDISRNTTAAARWIEWACQPPSTAGSADIDGAAPLLMPLLPQWEDARHDSCRVFADTDVLEKNFRSDGFKTPDGCRRHIDHTAVLHAPTMQWHLSPSITNTHDKDDDGNGDDSQNPSLPMLLEDESVAIGPNTRLAVGPDYIGGWAAAGSEDRRGGRSSLWGVAVGGFTGAVLGLVGGGHGASTTRHWAVPHSLPFDWTIGVRWLPALGGGSNGTVNVPAAIAYVNARGNMPSLYLTDTGLAFAATPFQLEVFGLPSVPDSKKDQKDNSPNKNIKKEGSGVENAARCMWPQHVARRLHRGRLEYWMTFGRPPRAPNLVAASNGVRSRRLAAATPGRSPPMPPYLAAATSASSGPCAPQHHLGGLVRCVGTIADSGRLRAVESRSCVPVFATSAYVFTSLDCDGASGPDPACFATAWKGEDGGSGGGTGYVLRITAPTATVMADAASVPPPQTLHASNTTVFSSVRVVASRAQDTDTEKGSPATSTAVVVALGLEQLPTPPQTVGAGAGGSASSGLRRHIPPGLAPLRIVLHTWPAAAAAAGGSAVPPAAMTAVDVDMGAPPPSPPPPTRQSNSSTTVKTAVCVRYCVDARDLEVVPTGHHPTPARNDPRPHTAPVLSLVARLLDVCEMCVDGGPCRATVHDREEILLVQVPYPR